MPIGFEATPDENASLVLLRYLFTSLQGIIRKFAHLHIVVRDIDGIRPKDCFDD